MTKTQLFFILIIAFTNCSSPHKKLEKVKDIEFNVGYNVTITGICYDYLQQRELIYFANSVSQKCIKFFTIDGQFNDSVSLKSASKELENIDGISVISKDTIVINSQYTNRYVVINRKGDIWLSIDMNELIDKTEPNFYEFRMSSVSNSSADKNTLLLNCGWYYNKKDKMMDNEPKDNLAYIKYYYEHVYQSPYFFKVFNCFTNHPTVSFGLEGFYKNLSEYSGVTAGPSTYCLMGKYTYVFSELSNTIFKTNTNTMKIEKRIKVASDFTTIGTPVPKITKESVNHIQDTVLHNERTKGLIASMYYSKMEEHFYVIVYHEVKNIKGVPERDLKRHFSIIIFNKEFEKIHEEAFMDGIYLGWGTLVTADGLIIPKINNNETKINNGKSTYTLFKYSE